MFNVFTMLIVLITVTSISVIITGSVELDPTLGPAFVDPHQKVGPTYIKYDCSIFYKEFLYKTSLNTGFWYIDGEWVNYRPYKLRPGIGIGGYAVINNNLVNLYTGNYMYPLLKDCILPLSKTYLGLFNFADAETLLVDLSIYKKYFKEGTLDVYQVFQNKNISLTGSDISDDLRTPFLEWYASWSNSDQFRIFRHFYFPLDRNIPTWVSILQITKSSFLHPSMLLGGTDWVNLCDSLTFSTIDFVEKENRLSLCSVNPDVWANLYTPEQAMFRYYEPTTGLIGFWAPADLVLNHEIQHISNLLEKKPEEVLAIFSNWLSPTSSFNTLYFNFVDNESFDWANDPRYDVQYIF